MKSQSVPRCVKVDFPHKHSSSHELKDGLLRVKVECDQGEIISEAVLDVRGARIRA